jgi:hypothetical protein
MKNLKRKVLALCMGASVFMCGKAFSQVPTYVPTNGLVGWWPFNGNANDESGNGNNGTVNGATLTNDRFNNIAKAYFFNNNSSEFISTNYFGVGGIGSRTISFWIKTNSSNIMHAVNYGGYQAATSSNAGSFFQCSFNYGGIGVNSNTGYSAITYECPIAVNNDQWSNYIWVFDSVPNATTQNIKIYQNTVLLTNVISNFNETTSLFTNIGINPLVFGKDYGDFHPFYGSMDDIGIWNRALTQQEITDLYNATNCSNDLTITPSVNSLQTGNTANFTATTSDANSTFIWQSDFGQGFQTLNDFGNYSGVNTYTLSIANVQLSEHNQPIRAISTAGDCIDTSNIAIIHIGDTCIANVTIYDTLLTTVTDTLIINTTLGLPAPNNENTILIYPNPASDHITIDNGNFAAMAGYTIKIENNAGQQVFQNAINQAQFYVDLSTWSGNGLYFVHLIDPQNNTVTVRKIVLQ